MTPTKGIEAIKELSAYSLTWYKEGNVKSKNEELQVVLKQIDNFENNMNIITEEVRMAQHKYETPMEGRISNLEETLNNFIKESLIRQKESKNMVWGIKKSYDQTFKTQASSIKKIEYHSGKIAKIIQDREARSLPSSTKTNPRGLAHAITTRNELNYKPPKNPLEDMTNPQGKTAVKETLTKNIEEALEQMPKYVKFMKDLLAKKGKAEETSKRNLNERWKISIDKGLADLGASISLMPYSMYARLDLGELKPTHVCIELANKATQYPRGIAENVIVKIDKFIFLVDFVVLDMKEDHKILIILGRPFLATAHAMTDVFNKKYILKLGMRQSSVLDHVREILPSNPLESFLFEPVINYQQRNTTNLWGDEDDNLDDSKESGSSSDHDD
ncbi:leucine-rich repeat receptor-like protein kinase PXL2 [Tanacetum coccineum]